MLETRRA
ncbi:hypothetical protein CIB84_004545 [Bambusicola thoracicus]|nr:hypothetical protein CIB84_004545 [Bambusicola thoracicus]